MTDAPEERRVRRPVALEDLPPPAPMNARKWATYLAYRAVWDTAAHLPGPLAWRLPRVAGEVWYRASRRRRAQVRANLARVVGAESPDELERLVRHAYRSYARYWMDAFRAHTLDLDDVMSRTTQRGAEGVEALLEDGQGAILATAHVGSWDLGAFFARSRGWRMAVVVELLEPRPLFVRFVTLRRQLGMEVIPLAPGLNISARLADFVREGGLATLVADRDLTGRGPVVEFFGEPCRLPPGPAMIGRRTRRPVVPVAFFTTPDGWRAVMNDPIDVSRLDLRAGTQAVARGLEDLIREAPEQWHVFVPNWLADREPGHPALRPIGDPGAGAGGGGEPGAEAMGGGDPRPGAPGGDDPGPAATGGGGLERPAGRCG